MRTQDKDKMFLAATWYFSKGKECCEALYETKNLGADQPVKETVSQYMLVVFFETHRYTIPYADGLF
jgi:hypothetical protein